MKLQQLRYLIAIANNNLNISAASEKLFTSQPGVSKQIKLLEEELGVQIFVRSGKNLTHITPVGRQILDCANSIMNEVSNIRSLAAEFKDDTHGTLRIATTHTQARYALPPVVREFRRRYPNISLQMQQGRPEEIAEMAASGEVDIAIATEAIAENDRLIMMPCYEWNRCVLVRPEHPLATVKKLTLQNITDYPLVTYVFGFTGRSQLDKTLAAANLHPNVVFTAVDSDVIKTYVRLDIGIGIIARMAYDPVQDADLVSLDTGHLFPNSCTKIGFRRGMFLRRYMYDFMELFSPHLTQEIIEQAANAANRDAVDALFANIELNTY